LCEVSFRNYIKQKAHSLLVVEWGTSPFILSSRQDILPLQDPTQLLKASNLSTACMHCQTMVQTSPLHTTRQITFFNQQDRFLPFYWANLVSFFYVVDGYIVAEDPLLITYLITKLHSLGLDLNIKAEYAGYLGVNVSLITYTPNLPGHRNSFTSPPFDASFNY
jgi:hypothetical protein